VAQITNQRLPFGKLKPATEVLFNVIVLFMFFFWIPAFAGMTKGKRGDKTQAIQKNLILNPVFLILARLSFLVTPTSLE
jgi:hypothetical protein